MSNSEIRAFAWNRLWKGRWFWKLFAITLFMQVCMHITFSFIGNIFVSLGVDDWMSYGVMLVQNWKDHITLVPNLTEAYIIRASGATSFELFIGLILTGIANYAAAIVLFKCLKDDQHRWFADSLAGFKTPFGLLGIAFVRGLIGLVWVGIFGMLPSIIILSFARPYLTTLADEPTFIGGVVSTVLFMAIFAWNIFCALVPFYRYRFLYLIKVEHPDYSVRECFRASRKLMKGLALKSFKLDCSYWKMITLDLVIVLALFALILFDYLTLMTGEQPVLSIVVSLLILVFFFAHILIGNILLYYISVGQGKFYLNHE